MASLLDKLCPAATFYLVVSTLAWVLMLIQNLGNTTVYCLGAYECFVPSTALIFGMKAAYIGFWTFVLNCICKAGYKTISWLIVLFPFILLFVLLGIFLLNQGAALA